MEKLLNNYEKNEYEIYKRGLKFVKQRKLALDIGACYGLWTQWMARDFQQVIAIEPAKLNWEKLVKNCSSNLNVEIINAAASDFTGSSELWNSIHKTNGVSGHWTLKKPKIKVGSQSVYCIKVDDLERIPDYVKIDVQGAELEVLIGMIITLNQYSPILNIETIQNEKHNDSIGKFLSKIGYQKLTNVGKHEIFDKK